MTDITFDISSLTIEEIELVEDITDTPIDELGNKGVKKGKLLRAIAYIEGRRANPDFTLEDASKVMVDPKRAAVPLAPAQGAASSEAVKPDSGSS